MINRSKEYIEKPKHRTTQYSKGITKEGLNIYCNCNDCSMYKDKVCTYYKSKVLNEESGCAHAVIKGLIKTK